MIAAQRYRAHGAIGWALTRFHRNRIEHPDTAQISAVLQHVVAGMDAGDGAPEWRVHATHWTSADIAITPVGPEGLPPQAVIRMAAAPYAIRGLHQNASAVRALHTDPRLSGWVHLAPRPLCEGALGEWRYAAEHEMPGVPALELAHDAATRGELQAASALAIHHLHRQTAETAVVDEALLMRWVDHRLKAVQSIIETLPRPLRATAALPRLARELRHTLSGQTVQIGWVHGDFWLGNVMLDADRRTPTGIVDWEWAAADELPAHDLLHLILFTRCSTERRELGAVIADVLRAPRWTPVERYILSLGVPDDPVMQRAMILLYWLRHIECNLNQSPHDGRHVVWITRNINAVLRSL